LISLRLAPHFPVSPGTLADTIAERTPVTPVLAQALSRELRTTAQFWINLQATQPPIAGQAAIGGQSPARSAALVKDASPQITHDW
jgi:hypothetical protein